MIDDFWHIFAFAIDYRKSSGIHTKLRLLLDDQVGPYKLILDHSLIAAQLEFFGRLNFPLMILLGNLTLVGLFALLWKNTPRDWFPENGRLLLLLPVSLLFFGLNYAETVDWAISGLQQPMVILLSLGAVHCLVNAGSRRTFALACVCGVLACATYSNGMLLWPLGVMYLFPNRNWGRLTAWCSAGAIASTAYLYHYSTDGLNAHASLGSKLLFFSMFCGSTAENMHHRPVPYISAAIGIIVLAVFTHAVSTRYDRRNPFFFYSMLWLLVTGAVVANARIAMGLQLSLSSRYKIYCDLMLIFCYEYLLDRVRHADMVALNPRRAMRWLGAATSVAFVLYIGSNIAGTQFLKTRQMRANGAMARYLVAPDHASPMFLVEDVLSPDELAQEDLARREMNEAIRLGIYRPSAR